MKRAARTLIYLQEVKLNDYDKLTEAGAESSHRFHELTARIKSNENRMRDIPALQKQITIYKRTLEAYHGYRDSKWSSKYYNAHDADITLHKAARKYFDTLGLEKLPSMESLKQEYARLAAGKGKMYGEYKQARQKMVELQTAKQNVDSVLSGQWNQPRLRGYSRERSVNENDSLPRRQAHSRRR